MREDFDGDLAERYGYVNRAIPDAGFEDFAGRFARRVSAFDRQALADIKHFINNVSLPPDEEFPPQMEAFTQALARPELQARARRSFEDGLQQRSDVERRLADYVGQIARADRPPAATARRSNS
jgi:enoyl-CoA hydratase/carnithine racemase